MECVYEARRILCDYVAQPTPSYTSVATPISRQERVQLVKQTISEEIEETEQLKTTDTPGYWVYKN